MNVARKLEKGPNINIETWGKHACFSRPELKTERVSYDVMTPSAARGILEAIYWHPGITYVIDQISVCNPIRFLNLRRNEVKSKIPASKVLKAAKSGKADLYIATSKDIVQRASLLLRDVRYIISAHMIIDPKKLGPADNLQKFYAILNRRIDRGMCYAQPVFGNREFPAHFKPVSPDYIAECPDDLIGIHDLGYMLWDIDYSDPEDIRPLFFRALLQNGILNVPARDSAEVIS